MKYQERRAALFIITVAVLFKFSTLPYLISLTQLHYLMSYPDKFGENEFLYKNKRFALVVYLSPKILVIEDFFLSMNFWGYFPGRAKHLKTIIFFLDVTLSSFIHETFSEQLRIFL